jgi:two-component system, NtrC family, sensor kinase
MDTDKLESRYRELQSYVGWTAEDAHRVQAIAPLVDVDLPALIDDFYAEIERHPDARKVITGGQPQIDRLKVTLLLWLRELLSGPYDRAYVIRRWRVGFRHLEIGLDQVFTNVALSRLRTGLMSAIGRRWRGDQDGAVATLLSLNKLFDLDLAKIEDAYQTEYLSRLQRSERLVTIGQIAGGVAHEVRNSLNVVKTSAYYLLNARKPTPEKTDEHLQRIGYHIGVADGVITALANFAKMPIPTLVAFEVGKCVTDALANNPLPAAIQTELDFAPTLPAALGDAAQIGIVFGNLIRNARDAMPKGGRLTIRGAVTSIGVEVSFADTGVGIAADNLGRIMEPLYSTKASGLGLGLALSKAILDKHLGTLLVVSEPDSGSTFTVRLKAHGLED